MQLLNKKEKRTLIGIYVGSIEQIKQEYNKPAEFLVSGKWIPSFCIRCAFPKCIYYAEDEIKCASFPDFAYDRNNIVCPMDAIKWDYTKESPSIDSSKCIDCGLCASRCPAGAIYSCNNSCHIALTNSCLGEISNKNIAIHKRLILKLESIHWNRHYKFESDETFEKMYHKLARISERSMIPNIMVRNIIIGLGYHCSNSRAGDVYTRIDAVYSRDSFGWLFDDKGAIEIEFGKDTLKASRSILDDIAVLHSRNGIDKKDNDAIVVCLSLPNKRQGYFQVIKDINRVLGLKIQTISVGGLLILLWNDINVEFGEKLFYADFDNMSIREALENLLKRKIYISQGHLGILEPNK